MGHLPFLVEHGRAISGLLVACGGVLGLAATLWVRDRFERGRVADERKARARSLGGLAPGRATISGRLRGRA